jgi:hypothetical protein
MIDGMDAGSFLMQGSHRYVRAEFFLHAILFATFLAAKLVDQLVAENIRPIDWVYSDSRPIILPRKRPRFSPCPPRGSDSGDRRNRASSVRVGVRAGGCADSEAFDGGKTLLLYFGVAWRLVDRYTAELGSSGHRIQARLEGWKPYDLMVYRRQE